MTIRDLALARGLQDTRAALVRWNAAPAPIVGRWVLGAFAVSCALLYIVWAISHRVVPDTRLLLLPGLNAPAGLGDVGRVIARNSLVLALHAMACVAGYIAGSALPAQAAEHRGAWRRVHELAGPAAIAFVGAATLFSLVTQAFVLGSDAATLGNQLGIGHAMLIVTLLPHALPELVALFLPLAAWLVASRQRRFNELLAATVATSALAMPVLVATALVEVYIWPDLLRAASPVA
ncbi:MAG TPA: stage II sporulation protein M [Solirubrobacteraceae bacterium]|nr:stage II sporulation protein M [Solirubrobacteraceae bacterium]